MLTQKEKDFFINLAKDSLHHYLSNENYISFDSEEVQELLGSETCLFNNQGCFVTLQKEGQLRGCIGTIISDEPLHKNIIMNAVSAGVKDPRFPEVSLAEYSGLKFEISVMGAVEPISDVEDIEVGTHGLIIKQGYRQGLLLPQVATEHGWSTIQFLEYTCQKASLHKDAWKEETTDIYWFSAEVFGEKNISK